MLYKQSATILSSYLWLRLTPATVLVSVAYEPWNTDMRDLRQFKQDLQYWGAVARLGNVKALSTGSC